MALRQFKSFIEHPNIAFAFSSLMALVMVICSAGIPFFWDNITISEIASVYYENSLAIVKLPARIDYGVFTLYGYYMAAVWMVFGKSLLVAHLAFFPVIVGVLYEIKRISLWFLRPGYLFLVYLFVFFDPALLTQTLIMGYDMFMLYFMLLAIRNLIEKKYLWYSLSMVFLSVISVRAVLFIFCLMLFHVLIAFREKEKLRFSSLLPYLPAAVVLSGWMAWHFYTTGWLFISNENSPFRSWNSLPMMMRHLGFMAWKLMDSGRIAIWVFCIALVFIKPRLLKAEKNTSILIALLIVPLMIYGLVLVLLSNPIGHKYFLLTFVALSLLAVYFIQQIGSRKKRLLISLSLLMFLFAGNFIIYPQKYGNAWDTSLKILPYFSAERKMKEFIKTNEIDPKEVYTDFPLTVNDRFSYLKEDFVYAELKAANIDSYPYVLFSNLLNVADLAPYKKVQDNWQLIYEASYCQVDIVLYKNPANTGIK
jgi:hypothetical protein